MIIISSNYDKPSSIFGPAAVKSTTMKAAYSLKYANQVLEIPPEYADKLRVRAKHQSTTSRRSEELAGESFVPRMDVDVFRSFRRLIPGFDSHFRALRSRAAGLGRDPDFDSTPAADEMGLVTLSWLLGNRNNRRMYDDITLSAVLIRENGIAGDILMGNGFHPDISVEHGVAPAVGLGQRHPDHFKGTLNFMLRDGSRFDQLYYPLGLMPWWYQILLMQIDVIRVSQKHAAFIATSDPGSKLLSKSSVPYYYLGQPGLWRADIEDVLSRTENNKVDSWLQEHSGISLKDLLIMGSPSAKDKGLSLFAEDAGLGISLQKLVAGVNWSGDIIPAITCTLGETSFNDILSDLKAGLPLVNEAAVYTQLANLVGRQSSEGKVREPLALRGTINIEL